MESKSVVVIAASAVFDAALAMDWVDRHSPNCRRTIVGSTGVCRRTARNGWITVDRGNCPISLPKFDLDPGILHVVALSSWTVEDIPSRHLIDAIIDLPSVLIFFKGEPRYPMAGRVAVAAIRRHAMVVAALRRGVLPWSRVLDQALLLFLLLIALLTKSKRMRTRRGSVQVIESLDTGGAQRQLLTFLERRRDQLPPVTMHVGNGFYAEPFSAFGCTTVELTRPTLLSLSFPLLRQAWSLRSELIARQAGVAVGWLTIPIVLLPVAVIGLPIRTIANERNISDWKSWPIYASWWRRCAERLAARAHHGIIGNSRAVVESYERWTGCDQRRMAVVYNGVDVATYHARPWSDPRPLLDLPDHLPIVLAIGRLAAEKDFPMFIRAVKRLKSSGIRCVAVLAGHGEEEHALRQLARDQDVLDMLRFVGSVNDPQSYFRAATIVAMTSRAEGMPNVAIEAAVFAKPIVATPAGGTGEIVIDGVTGFLVPMGDDTAMADSIAKLLRDPASIRSMGQRAKRWISALSVSRMCDGISRVMMRRPR